MAMSTTRKVLLIVGGIVLFLVMVVVLGVALIFSALRGNRPSIQDNSVLALRISGSLPDYVPDDPFRRIFGGQPQSLGSLMAQFRKAKVDKRITAVIPYYGYARSDKKDRPRVPIAAKMVANLIATAGAQRVLTMDLHAAQIQGFFDIPVDHLYAAPVMIGHYQQNTLPNLTVVAPDTGGAERARAYAKRLNAELAL